MKNEIRDVLYIHQQASERFVISYGMEFKEFVNSLPKALQNVLLLKHRYEDGEFNINTLLDYVTREDLPNLLKENVYEYGDFCWIDFAEEEGLEELDGQEIAELLYLGHCKGHLKAPFYPQLNNQFVYLAHDDGWFNKIYYRSMDTFFDIMGQLIPAKMETVKRERTWLGIRKKTEYPAIPAENLKVLSHLMAEGMAISFNQLQQSRNKIEIPIWILGDYVNMDDMLEEYKGVKNQVPDAKIIFNRKTKEWSIALK